MAAYADIAFATSLYGSDYVTVAFDRDNDGVVDTVAAELMFDIVSAEIDSFLVNKVPMPLTEVPLDLKMRCVDLCIYRMCPEASRLTTEKIDRFKAAQKWLEMVAEGVIKLTADGAALTGANKNQKATLTTAATAAQDQESDARWFKRDRTNRCL
jgi:phage gp36-like protein